MVKQSLIPSQLKTIYDPFFIGFDNILSHMSELNSTCQSAYPFYNILKTDENSYVIEIAVAGFDKSNLTVTQDNNQLKIIGEHAETAQLDGEYLFKGISSKRFERVFKLSDTVKIDGSTLDGGILKIFLKNEIPKAKEPRVIDII